MEGKTIIAVIAAGVSYMAINKWIWTPMKRGPNPIRKDDNDPASLPSSAAEASSSSPPPPEQKDDPASLPSSSAEASSSSPPPPPGLEYDVFLSFRGADTRKGITSDLYHKLQRSGIKTFMDDPDLEVGDAISPTLIAAIEQSRFAIVVLSRDYASSTWCLEELAKICECLKDQNRILPLFYHVEPSDVRYQKKSFEEAFSKHETSGRCRSEKVKQWRDALNKVADFSGWNTQDYKTERELVDKIVDFVYTKVQPIDIEFTMSNGDFESFEATRKAMDEVMKELKDDEVTAVGVYGMGGVGKTTMVQHVAAESCKNGTFHHVIMAVVSQSPNFERIQGTLLVELLGQGFELPECGRASRLYKEIMRKNNILIILDDIWGFIDLSKTIGIPSPDRLKKRNSKVLLTSRRLHVCNSMSQTSIHLDILSEQDSWSLFVKKTKRYFESPNFDNVARKVARECRGLPIALIAVARALGDKDLEEWQKAAQQLRKSQIANPDHEEVAFECIKLSYDYLKHEDHKSCFLLCCLFREDYDIPIEDLFKYAIGKGLFRDTVAIYEARGIAHTVVKHLKDCSLLLESKYRERVRMHDVVRDTAIKIANGHGFLVKAGCGLKDWPHGLHEGYSAISLMENEIRSVPEELVGPNLQILLLQKNTGLNEIPETFFQSPNELRLLDLSKTSISSLPQSFSLLTNLQALYLDFCKKLIDISIVGKLKKLEILSMREYPLKELSREIGHLTNLRMLDVGGRLEDGGIVTIPSEVISKLHMLEELYLLNCGCKNWKRQTEGEGEETNIGFGDLAGLSKLKNLQVSISDAECIPKNVEVEPGWVHFDIRIGGQTGDFPNYCFGHNSRSVVLEGVTISTLPDWFINAVTKKTEYLEYNSCNGMSDILMEYDHGRLHKLEHLRLGGYYLETSMYLKELMNTTRRVQKGPVFENLEKLDLIALTHLEKLCVGELPPGSFINLKALLVYECYFLKNVSKFVQRLPNLDKLGLKQMYILEYVFVSEGFEPKQSKLREMHLLNLHALRSICSGPAPRAMFQSLKSLTIYDCKLLQNLFTSDVAECLFQLEDLFVELCPLLERVIEEVNNEKIVLPKLKNLVLKELPKLYGATATVDIECPSLEHLVVVDCLQFSFSTSYDLENWNQFSFTTFASNYFRTRNPVKLNDRQLYKFLRDR
ncbi:hypothetical protein ABKV19_002747 [Rosa sericea]